MVLFVLILYSRQMTEDSFTWCNFNDLEIPTWFLLLALCIYFWMDIWLKWGEWDAVIILISDTICFILVALISMNVFEWEVGDPGQTELYWDKPNLANQLISESYYSPKTHFLVYWSIQTFPTGPNPKQLFSSSINGNNFQFYSDYSIIRNLSWITFTTSMESEAVPVCVYSLDMNETRLANE